MYHNNPDFLKLVLKVLANINIDTQSGCHIYLGNIDSHIGYGRVMIDGTVYHTHRLSAWAHLGLNLDNWKEFACHKCSNRACCNPEHLYVGDNKQNQLDAVNNTCKYGHALIGYNAMIRRRSDGKTFRNCRKCHNGRTRRSYDKLHRKK